ncbi:CMRF35-like molecule 7 [Otolemur garnettii]|uniref:CMRF35-like molecule 7 n=1 Tax=Otolemur garnettii TaxID=30611 RepID=UPI0006442A18|nr:CMRF35-like molecule 7 [Otolemur garnettii]
MWLPLALLLLSLSGSLSIQAPEFVRAPERGVVVVQCRYDQGWETHEKWWCRGVIWHSCKILIQTRGSEQEVKSDRVSIRDSWTDRTFTVTMKGLRQGDADTYWCGIKKIGTDLGTQVKVIIDPVRMAPSTASFSSKPFVMPPVNINTGMSSGSNKRTYYLLLAFVKVPILLILAGAVLWLKESQRVPQEL